jgi:hypothetical protein
MQDPGVASEMAAQRRERTACHTYNKGGWQKVHFYIGPRRHITRLSHMTKQVDEVRPTVGI